MQFILYKQNYFRSLLIGLFVAVCAFTGIYIIMRAYIHLGFLIPIIFISAILLWYFLTKAFGLSKTIISLNEQSIEIIESEKEKYSYPLPDIKKVYVANPFPIAFTSPYWHFYVLYNNGTKIAWAYITYFTKNTNKICEEINKYIASKH